jgi:2-polyprenyl-3-methyl-5-hydroxy-6-metoxy-1,4-benzoquinol methylase
MNCEICGNKIRKILSLKNNRIYSCVYCNHFFCDEIKNENNYTVYKEYEYLLRQLRDKNYNKIMKNIRNILPVNAFGLEIASALGWFLHKCANNGYMMTGIEPIKYNFEKSLSVEEAYTVINGYFPDCLPENEYKNKYDFIVFNDVFEHIPDIKETLTACNKFLKQGGYLIINLPINTGILFKIASMLAMIGKNKSLIRLWQFETESPHLHYFSEKSLKTLVNKNGFSSLVEFSLNTVDSGFEDTYKRVIGIGNYGKVSALIIAIITSICTPLWKFLPKDTKCFIFQKEE